MEMHNHFTVDVAMDYLGLPAYVRAVIKGLYSEPHRTYHNLDHLNQLLRWVSKDHLDREVLLDSILWHDIVYPAKLLPMGLAETLSAAEYSRFSFIAGNNVPDIDPSGRLPHNEKRDLAVIEAINASARHLEDQRFISDTTKFFLDLDLQSFAQPWEEMNADSEKVMMEISPVVGMDAFLKGNIQFLTQLLKRKRIYYAASDAWELQARKNIKKRISIQKKKLPPKA